jgi:nitrite reductase/ring-hydroxylating ferredoxin subunit
VAAVKLLTFRILKRGYQEVPVSRLTRSEFIEIQKAAEVMTGELEQWKWDVAGRSSKACDVIYSERLSAIRVTMSAVTGRYSDVSLISGNSDITVTLPNQGYIAFRAKKQEIDAVRRMIYGLLVHECVHVVQKQDVPEDFKTSVAGEKVYFKINSPTHDQSFDLYVGKPLEQEARAHQAVAEIFDEYRNGLNRAEFDVAWASTQLFIRTEKLIGPRSAASPKMEAWWTATQALAWDIYQTL